MIVITDKNVRSDLPSLMFEHGIVVLRGLDVDDRSIINIGEMFGDILKNTQADAFAVNDDPRILRVSNIKVDDKPAGLFGQNDLEWHNDFAHSPGHYHGLLLYNFEGGELAETIFCDTRSAWDGLDESHKAALHGVIGHHRVTHKAYRRELSNAEKRLLSMKQWRIDKPEYTFGCLHEDDTLRPMIAVHPVTGRKSLYLSPATYVGSEPTISDSDYMDLVRHCDQEKYIYTHRWQPNDVVLFDNLSTMHRRGGFDGTRILWRMQFNYDKHVA